MPTDVAALDAIEPAHIPAAIAHLAARLLTQPTAPTEDEDFSLTVADAAKLLRVSPRHIYRQPKASADAASRSGSCASRARRFPAI